MVLMLVPMASDDKNSHFTSHFNHFDLTNGVVPFIALLASCDTDRSTSGNTWPEKLCCTLFELSLPNEYNGAINSAIGIT